MMSEQIIIGFYIEDDEADRNRYSELLSDKKMIEVTSICPPKHIDELELSPIPDVVLIDYNLKEEQSSGEFVKYRGGTLSNYIAEQFPVTPLVILSTKDVFNLFPNYEEEIQSVDYILYKDCVNNNPEFGRNLLVNLSEGFKIIANIKEEMRTWPTLLNLLKAESSEDEFLERSAPPRIEKEKWRVHSISKWILKILFEYPGVFYDSLYASTALGLREEAFLREEVQKLFKAAEYTGVFGGIKRLWWKDRLQKLAFQKINEANLGPILSENFSDAFHKTEGIELAPSICVFSDEEHANTVCHILGKPVKMKYTLGYLPDTRPESMDQARISFKAILEEDVNETLLPSADAELVESIRRKYKVERK